MNDDDHCTQCEDIIALDLLMDGSTICEECLKAEESHND